MVDKSRAWIGQEPVWDVTETEEAGGVAVLLTLHAGEPETESAPVEVEEEVQPATAQPEERKPSRERRHLAGANWLDDWTLYFPSQPLPKPKKPRAK